MKKRIITLMVIMVLVITLLPSATVDVSADSVPHTHNSITFNAWERTDSLPSEQGNYYLLHDVTLTGKWSSPVGTTNLCLNGHVITTDNAGDSVIRVDDNALLNLYDCDTTSSHYFTNNNENSSLWKLQSTHDADTEHTVSGGAISGSKSSTGCIEVHGGTFTMNGGTICGNAGPGISVGSNAAASSISGNFTMNGGCISNNNNTEYIYGGGIYLACGDITINDGYISNNTSQYGGGIYITSGNLTIAGGNINVNTASDDGGGIYLNEGNLTLNGGRIQDNIANHGGGIFLDHGNIYINGGYIQNNKSNNLGGGISVKPCGTGYTGNLTITGGEIIYNEISSNSNDGYGGGVYFEGTGTFTMTGGTIEGNKATGYGGGIFLCNDCIGAYVGGSAVVRTNSTTLGQDRIDESNIHLQSYNGVQAKLSFSSDKPLLPMSSIGVSVYVSDPWGPGTEIDNFFNSLDDNSYKYIVINNSKDGASNRDTLFSIAKGTGNHVLTSKTHYHNLVKIDSQAATYDASGYKEYYECKDTYDRCYKYYEDSEGTTEITNLVAWKSEGGNGYIAKLERPTPTPGPDPAPGPAPAPDPTPSPEDKTEKQTEEKTTKPAKAPYINLTKTIGLGNSFKLNVTNVFDDAKVSFISSDKSVAKVDKTGVITAVGTGKCKITGVVNQNNIKYKYVITVKVKKTSSGNRKLKEDECLTPNSLTPLLNIYKVVGAGKDLNLNLKDLAKDAVVTCSSEDESIATVTDDGVITGIKKGYTGINVSIAQDDTVFQYRVYVRVKKSK